MAPSITSSKVTLKYPIFCADFFDSDDTDASNKWPLAVAGGGGQGRSGVGNRITILGDNLQSLSEVELSREEDSVMSLCTTPDNGVLAGINSASEKILSTGVNEHLRGFRYFPKNGKLEGEIYRRQVFSNSTVKVRDSYQRLLRRARRRDEGQVVALASGGGSGKETVNEIIIGRIHDSINLSVVERVNMPPGSEAVDIDIIEEDEMEQEKEPKYALAYCHPKDIFLHKAGASQNIYTVSPPAAGSFRALRLLSPTLVVATLNLPSRSGAEILLITPTETLLRKPLHKGIKAVTAIDAYLFPGARQAVVAIAGADMAIEIVAIDLPTPTRGARLRSVKIINSVHPFQITKVAIAQPRKFPGGWETRIATTSIGQTVVVFTVPLISQITLPSTAATTSEEEEEEAPESLFILPPRGAKRTLAKSIAATASTVLISLGLVIITAIILQIVFVYRGGLPDSDISSILVRGREIWQNYLPDAETQEVLREVNREQEVLIEHEHVDGKRRKKAEKEVEDVAEVVKDFVADAAEVAGEWVVEESRKVAGGVVKGMLRGAVEDVVQNIMRV
ncbi:hypothetical protein DFH27DRAFT_599467 [Peziza echinospora]|nr:hypothetical protein DFH27DRAFT_599467 [Peziza echinospora]